MVRFNFSLDDVENCPETTAFVKKGLFNSAYIKRLLFEKSKENENFRAIKTSKRYEKYSKLKLVINFGLFQ